MEGVALLLLYLSPWIACAASVAFTALHTFDEVTAEGGPIWSYLGLSHSFGAGLFGLTAFAALQIGLAAHGYLDGARWAYGALLAVRLGDCVVSHWGPWLRGRRPNPGLATTPLYAGEALLIGLIPGGAFF